MSDRYEGVPHADMHRQSAISSTRGRFSRARRYRSEIEHRRGRSWILCCAQHTVQLCVHAFKLIAQIGFLLMQAGIFSD
jgi:hypothetical protein